MAESMDERLELADVYASALYALAAEKQVVDDIRAELEALQKMATDEPGLATFLESNAVDDDDRRASLERMFRGRLSDILLNALQVMNEHGRAGLLNELVRAFVLRQQRAANQLEVVATSAVELSAEQQDAVRQMAAELSGKEPLMTFAVDEKVVGGLVLQIGDYRFDNSVRRQLVQARTHLQRRAALGLNISAEQ